MPSYFKPPALALALLAALASPSLAQPAPAATPAALAVAELATLDLDVVAAAAAMTKVSATIAAKAPSSAPDTANETAQTNPRVGDAPPAAAEIDTATAAKSEAETGTTLVARIDLTSQTMTVAEAGRVVHTWKISSGRAGFHTPTGTFRPNTLVRMHYSRKYYGAPMPYSVFFRGGVATHGTRDLGRLGRPASHGCVRLTTANARAFYELVRKHGKAHTQIVVVGKTPYSAPVATSQRRPARSASSSRSANWQRNAFTPGG